VVFSKEDTNRIKGAAILMLLFYHLFYYEPMFDAFPVDFQPFTLAQVMYSSRIWNICVSIFLFLTVFAMFRNLDQLRKSNQGSLLPKQYFWFSLKRYFSMMFGYVAVYVTMLVFFSWDIWGLNVYGKGIHACYNVFMDITGISQFIGTPSINSSWWYLELVIIVIFLMPLLYAGMEKWGACMVPLLLILPFVINVGYMTEKYRVTVLLALCCAKWNLLERWKGFVWRGHIMLTEWIKFLIMTSAGCIAAYFRQFQGDAVPDSVHFVAEGILALVLIAILYEYAGQIRGFRKGLSILGKNSLNIYFAHLFFSYYMIKIRSVIFSFHFFILIYLVQIGIVLGYSVLLNQLKKISGYEKMVASIRAFCDKKIQSA
jgi:hypothetical protein